MITNDQIIEAALECAEKIVFNLEGRKGVIDLDLEEELVKEIMAEMSDETKRLYLIAYRQGLLDGAARVERDWDGDLDSMSYTDGFNHAAAELRQMADEVGN
jgi:hypothetical protein